VAQTADAELYRNCAARQPLPDSCSSADFPANLSHSGENGALANNPPMQSASLLPAQPIQAKRFGKTRVAQSHAVLEDYAELIDDLRTTTGTARPTDIARRLGVSHATAIKNIGRLKREGLATTLPYRGVSLTEAGEALAAQCRARHRLVVDVLTAIGVPQDAAEDDAEGIEHHISPTTLAAFRAFLERG
jgi:DtxR family manganese transport transcriptional regulator